MRTLSAERALLEAHLPGFDGWLAELGIDGAEDPEGDVIEAFRRAGGGNLFVPRELGGAGLGCRDGVRLQRAVGTRAPALAVATTMHHYKVAWLAAALGADADAVLREVAEQRHLVASCGAEGQVGRSLFTPGIRVAAADGGLTVSGTKRPCSLTRSMGLLTLTATAPDDSAPESPLLMLVIPADAPGIRREPFWRNRVLRATQTDAVLLDEVFVPDSMIIPIGDPALSPGRFTSNLLWFQLLITASYLGIATGQVERLHTAQRGTPGDRVAALAPLETVCAALEALAREVDEGRCDDDLLGRSLLVRHTAQRAIAEATDRALELAGGMPFVTGSQGVDALAASRGLAFHPPSEISAREPLDTWLGGGGLTLK
ncbi:MULTISPECIES: acyl-CoA dehydrogenase family protein [unclassified Streptomyces]|uniref:acyl-CoA dehydrogenase family protein n=1 Tax=unclassified Streptomyces TaxID=2593676 RepID=UPI000DABC07E|nr:MULTISPECIES: acyl-CoA dehydrogenase family protein [unclassified Streptomyces]PZT76134.1 acyl-CoA dehydrogenase [Streptomyces sp. AC1-42W]PZT79914.1 acyl-CoA dehydrogenase [Streptomyces sp. AC1-42T]